jgi:acyl carrier protein
MRHEDIVRDLREFISERILEGEDVGLDETTPLIEWGILNSMEMIRMVGFISERYAVDLPSDTIRLDNFKDLGSLARLVAEQRGRSTE